MTKPQQPEVRRSGYGATDDDSAKAKLGGSTDVDGTAGPVPEGNRPDHHPDEEQDKPEPV